MPPGGFTIGRPVLTVDTLRVAIVADLLEEGWPSMDLVADMLMAHAAGDGYLTPSLLRPRFAAVNGDGDSTPPTIRRIAYRFWSYPRWLRQQPAADVYHIVDHSYAHLAHDLPRGRVVVTCHDTDAFRSLLHPSDRESGLPRWLVKRVLRGLQLAAAVVCDSEATRAELVDHALVPLERTTVLPVGEVDGLPCGMQVNGSRPIRSIISKRWRWWRDRVLTHGYGASGAPSRPSR